MIRISCWTFLATGVLLSRDIFRLSPAPLFIASTPCAFLYSSDATELPLVPQEQVLQLLHPRRHNNHYISALNQCAYSTDACSSFLKLKSSFKPDVPLFGMLSTQYYYHRVCAYIQKRITSADSAFQYKKKSAEKVRKFSRQNFATKVRKSSK